MIPGEVNPLLLTFTVGGINRMADKGSREGGREGSREGGKEGNSKIN